jgi:hypothetical protein
MPNGFAEHVDGLRVCIKHLKYCELLEYRQIDVNAVATPDPHLQIWFSDTWETYTLSGGSEDLRIFECKDCMIQIALTWLEFVLIELKTF